MDEQTAITTLATISNVDLALAGWLDAHQGSVKTLTAYQSTLTAYRATLAQIGLEVDSDVTQVVMMAQRFASFSSRRGRASNTTINQRLAILSSFYEYALSASLLRIEVNPIN